MLAGALLGRVRVVVGDFFWMNLLKGDRGDRADAALAADVLETADDEVAGPPGRPGAGDAVLVPVALSLGDRSVVGGLASSCWEERDSGSVNGSGAALRPMLADDALASR